MCANHQIDKKKSYFFERQQYAFWMHVSTCSAFLRVAQMWHKAEGRIDLTIQSEVTERDKRASHLHHVEGHEFTRTCAIVYVYIYICINFCMCGYACVRLFDPFCICLRIL